MSDTFPSDQFLHTIQTKCPNPQPCPFCGGQHFSSLQQFANLPVQSDQDGFSLGQSLPCGVLICTNCGHVNFFALAALGLKKGGAEGNAK